jgi:hypothetical protein
MAVISVSCLEKFDSADARQGDKLRTLKQLEGSGFDMCKLYHVGHKINKSAYARHILSFETDMYYKPVWLVVARR